MVLIPTLAFLFTFVSQIYAQYASRMPAVAPLALRSPYLHVWSSTSGTAAARGVNGQAAKQWSGSNVGWTGLVRVGSSTFSWQGAVTDIPAATVIASQITPTRTIFTYQAAGVQFNVTFFSPVEPSDWVLQSFPFAYILIDGVRSIESGTRTAQFYYETDGELAWPNPEEVPMLVTFVEQPKYLAFKVTTDPSSKIPGYQTSLREEANQAVDGTMYFSVTNSSSTSWQVGLRADVRSRFQSGGQLSNLKVDTPTLSPARHVMAFSTALQSDSLSNRVVLQIGYLRSPEIRVVRKANEDYASTLRYSLFQSANYTIGASLEDLPAALARAETLDRKIMRDASSITPAYADLVALSTRLALGALHFTVKAKDGTTPTYESDVWITMKDIGISSRASPIESIYAAMPAYLYLNSTILGGLLRPLLDLQPQGNDHAALDLGDHYPVVSPLNEMDHSSSYAVDTSSTMLIMLLAHAQKSGDGSLISQYYDTLKGYADTLVQNTMTESSSFDGLNYSRGTNLGLKGVIGLKAMSLISRMLEIYGGSRTDSTYYAEKADTLAQRWKATAVDGDHVVSDFTKRDNWGMLSNAYADKLLKTGVLDSSILDKQASFYAKQLEKAPAFGLAMDSSNSTNARSDFTMFTAATIANTTVRNRMIESLIPAAFQSPNGSAWPSWYHASTGASSISSGSPAQGAMFALLALNVPDSFFRSSTVRLSDQYDPKKATWRKITIIVGAVVGFLVLLCILKVCCASGSGKRRPAPSTTTTVLLKPVVHHYVVASTVDQPERPEGASVQAPASISRGDMGVSEAPYETNSLSPLLGLRMRQSAPSTPVSATTQGPETPLSSQPPPPSFPVAHDEKPREDDMSMPASLLQEVAALQEQVDALRAEPWVFDSGFLFSSDDVNVHQASPRELRELTMSMRGDVAQLMDHLTSLGQDEVDDKHVRAVGMVDLESGMDVQNLQQEIGLLRRELGDLERCRKDVLDATMLS